jgi:Zn-finger nucleic acid-binding protein
MQALNRSGVEFDMCPSCRGVWLDRGELEKVIENVRAEATAGAAPSGDAYRAPQPSQHSYGERGRYRDDDDDRDEYRSDPRHHRRRKGFDMFDIFD